MYIWSRSSAATVLRNARKGRDDTAALTLHTARNMTVCGQLILREITDFTVTAVTFGDLPQGVTASWHPVRDITFNDGVPYPDILSNDSTVVVKAHTACDIWITLTTAQDATPGTCTVPVTVQTSLGAFTVCWTLTVHTTTLPDPAASAFGHEYFFSPFAGFSSPDKPEAHPVEPFYTCTRGSDEWWALMRVFAETMKSLRVNSLHLPLIPLLCQAGSRRLPDGTWALCFDEADRFIEHFLTYGSFRYITISAVIASVDGKTITAIDEAGRGTALEIFTSDAEAWAEAFYGGIYQHFCAKGWLPMLQMRLQDEPHSAVYWQWAREKCRVCMPGVPCGEPIDMHAVGKELAGYCDEYVPRLEVYEEGADFYRARQAAGDTVWCYSCCYPEEPWYLNKFIDQPHLYARLIHWVCFVHGITGFLHWGFNYWGGSMYGMCPEARFKGDGFIVYPDPAKNSLMMSVRGAATRDGLEDWELLHLLADRDPDAAAGIARRVARSFSDFTPDPHVIDAARAEVLTLLDRT